MDFKACVANPKSLLSRAHARPSDTHLWIATTARLFMSGSMGLSGLM